MPRGVCQMNELLKSQIGQRVREKREQAGYTREKLGELCSLSPRFIANVELGDATFSLDSLITVCKVLSCSSDYILFGNDIDNKPWSDVIAKLQHLDLKYQPSMSKTIQAIIESIIIAEKNK